MTTKRSYSAKAACKVSFLLLVDVSLDTRFSWPVVFPLQDKSG